jgi:hypothetical protein
MRRRNLYLAASLLNRNRRFMDVLSPTCTTQSDLTHRWVADHQRHLHG